MPLHRLDPADSRRLIGATLRAHKLDGAVARLADGRVVIPSDDGLELFRPATAALTRLPGTTYDAGSFRTVTPLDDHRVLVAGGYDEAIVPTDRAVVVTVPPPVG